jgi:hypothetical protein
MIKKILILFFAGVHCSYADVLDTIYPSYANPFSNYWSGRHWKTLTEGDYESLSENDVGITDGKYTNGITISVSDMNPTPFKLTPSGHLEQVQTNCSSNNECKQIESPAVLHTGYILGQTMYTPDDMSDSPELKYSNGKLIGGAPTYVRPYAGFSFVGLTTKLFQTDRIDTFGLIIGMVGPASGADSKQTWAHENLSPKSRKPAGWETQIKNRPAVQMYRFTEYNDKISSNMASFGFFTSAEYGTVFNRAGGGIYASISSRVEENCKFSLISPTQTIPKSNKLNSNDSQDTTNYVLGCNNNRSRLMLYARLGGKGVLNNALIDEGIHYDANGDGVEETYDRQHSSFITEATIGFNIKVKSWFDFGIFMNTRSPEVANKPYDFDEHTWYGLNFQINNFGIFRGILATGSLYGAGVYANRNTEDLK